MKKAPKPAKASRRARAADWDERFARLVLDSNPLPAFVTDVSDFRLLAVNEAAVKKYGWTRAQFLRMKLTDFRPPEDVPRLVKYVRTKIKGLRDVGRWRHRLKDGRLIDVDVKAHALVWDGRKAVLSIAHDISEQRRLQSALRGIQTELSEVVGNAPVVLFLVDREGRFVLSEGKGLAMLGLKPGEVVGKSVYEVYRDVPRIGACIRRAMAGESFADNVEVGSLVFNTHYAPHFNEAGEIDGVMGVGVDSTERRRADSLLHQQAAAIRASMDGMAVHDEEGRFVYLNDAHARLYGFARPEDLLGKTWKSLYAPEELARFEREIMPRFWKEGSWRGEALGRRLDGTTFPQDLSLIRIEGGGLVCVARDISDRKRAEAEHGRLLSLEKNARAEAEAASRAKDEFLAVVSHELRTPMTAILGWTWLLRSGDVPQSERARALEIIERNMKLQAQIIEDLLDLSSIVTGKLQLDVRPVELDPVLRAAVDTIRSAAQAKSVRFEIECGAGLSVFGDHYRLQQVFWNLLSNAVKFNRDAGLVRVRARSEGGCALVAIEDEGLGIDAEFLPEMFHLFRQGESSLTRQHRGLGIGLAIVRHLIELHGGTVQASSRGPGQGAAFTVALPLADSGAEARPPGLPALMTARRSKLAHALDHRKILVVDDEVDTLEMLAELLAHCGAVVTKASSVEDALAAFETARPELLIADIAMPVEDGYSLIRKVRALGHARGGDVLALALTARAKDEDRDEAMRAGFQMYLAKPVEPEDLVTAINNLVRAEQAQ